MDVPRRDQKDHQIRQFDEDHFAAISPRADLAPDDRVRPDRAGDFRGRGLSRWRFFSRLRHRSRRIPDPQPQNGDAIGGNRHRHHGEHVVERGDRRHRAVGIDGQRVQDQQHSAKGIAKGQNPADAGFRPQHSRGSFNDSDEQHQPQHADRQRLKRFFTPERDERAPTAGGQSRRRRQPQRPADLFERDPPENVDQHENRHRGRYEHRHRQQARQQFSEHQFAVAQVGHQEQNQCLPVFFLGDPAGGKQRREERHERQLNHRKKLEQQAAKARHVSQVADLLPSKRRLPRRVHQNKQGADVACPEHEMPRVARRGQNFSTENRAGEQDVVPSSKNGAETIDCRSIR
jgi:hypothetical protein